MATTTCCNDGACAAPVRDQATQDESAQDSDEEQVSNSLKSTNDGSCPDSINPLSTNKALVADKEIKQSPEPEKVNVNSQKSENALSDNGQRSGDALSNDDNGMSAVKSVNFDDNYQYVIDNTIEDKNATKVNDNNDVNEVVSFDGDDNILLLLFTLLISILFII